jgi:hypothetical protein
MIANGTASARPVISSGNGVSPDLADSWTGLRPRLPGAPLVHRFAYPQTAARPTRLDWAPLSRPDCDVDRALDHRWCSLDTLDHSDGCNAAIEPRGPVQWRMDHVATVAFLDGEPRGTDPPRRRAPARSRRPRGRR